MKSIYLATSWSNKMQPAIVRILRGYGFDVYDFQNPDGPKTGFKWEKIDPNWEQWGYEEQLEALTKEKALMGFQRDFEAMEQADVCVLMLPSGRSAHIEAGWMNGKGKSVYVYNPMHEMPDLMHLLFDGIYHDIHDLIEVLKS